MSTSARPNIALERTGHTTGFLLHASVSGVWPAAHRGRYTPSERHMPGISSQEREA
jgi:hypothetical protein